MKWFYNLKISAKLMFSFAIVLIITMVIGSLGIINLRNTDLNIILGLCVGHDSLFIKYSDAPVTVFAVKDRVLAHNPLGALYLSESYYKKKLYHNANNDKKE